MERGYPNWTLVKAKKRETCRTDAEKEEDQQEKVLSFFMGQVCVKSRRILNTLCSFQTKKYNAKKKKKNLIHPMDMEGEAKHSTAQTGVFWFVHWGS